MNYSKLNSKRTDKKVLFSGEMKLADLIDTDYNLLGVLSKMKVHLGFGEKTVSQVCEQNGIDLDTFIMICNVYSLNDFSTSKAALDKLNIKDILSYLHNSHSYYMNTALVTLADLIKRLIEACNDNQKKIVWKFFTEYKEELDKHFDYEENEVFPYVRNLVERNNDLDKNLQNYSIRQFEKNHSNIDEKLNDLKNIVMKYLPNQCDNDQRAQVLFFIYHLENDLSRHTLIEDDILIPLVSKIEQNVNRE